MVGTDFGIWRVRIALLPDGTEAVGENAMPQWGRLGTKEEVIADLKRHSDGYTLEIAREYQDSLGRVIRKRLGPWQKI